MSDKSDKLIAFALKNGNKITSKDAFKLIGGSYYCNGRKHTGDMLGRMVKSGMLVREKKGSFILVNASKGPKIIDHPNQIKLL